MKMKTLARYCRLVRKPPTWHNLHRRRALYDDIMDHMTGQLRLFCIWGAITDPGRAEDLLDFAQAELEWITADLKAQQPPPPGAPPLPAALAEAILKHGAHRYKHMAKP